MVSKRFSALFASIWVIGHRLLIYVVVLTMCVAGERRGLQPSRLYVAVPYLQLLSFTMWGIMFMMASRLGEASRTVERLKVRGSSSDSCRVGGWDVYVAVPYLQLLSFTMWGIMFMMESCLGEASRTVERLKVRGSSGDSCGVGGVCRQVLCRVGEDACLLWKGLGCVDNLFLTPNSRSVFRAGVSLNIHSFIHSCRQVLCHVGGGGEDACLL